MSFIRGESLVRGLATDRVFASTRRSRRRLALLEAGVDRLAAPPVWTSTIVEVVLQQQFVLAYGWMWKSGSLPSIHGIPISCDMMIHEMSHRVRQRGEIRLNQRR